MFGWDIVFFFLLINKNIQRAQITGSVAQQNNQISLMSSTDNCDLPNKLYGIMDMQQIIKHNPNSGRGVIAQNDFCLIKAKR